MEEFLTWMKDNNGRLTFYSAYDWENWSKIEIGARKGSQTVQLKEYIEPRRGQMTLTERVLLMWERVKEKADTL